MKTKKHINKTKIEGRRKGGKYKRKSCTKKQIRNPKSKRCILKNGKLAKKLGLNKSHKNNKKNKTYKNMSIFKDNTIQQLIKKQQPNIVNTVLPVKPSISNSNRTSRKTLKSILKHSMPVGKKNKTVKQLRFESPLIQKMTTPDSKILNRTKTPFVGYV